MKITIELDSVVEVLRTLYTDSEKRNLVDNELGTHFRLDAICDVANAFEVKLNLPGESLVNAISDGVAESIRASAK